MTGFVWHDMNAERPEKGRGTYIIMGVKGGLYLSRRFEGYGGEVWFRDTRGNHHYPSEVLAWAEVPKYDKEASTGSEGQGSTRPWNAGTNARTRIPSDARSAATRRWSSTGS